VFHDSCAWGRQAGAAPDRPTLQVFPSKYLASGQGTRFAPHDLVVRGPLPGGRDWSAQGDMKMTSYIHRISLGLGATALVLATAAFAQAAQQTTTDKAREAGREVKQDTRDAARDTGNAVTDSWVTMKIHSQFIPEDALEDSDIDVTTRKGVVTLTGTVASLAGRDRAVAIAKATDGVKSVTNRLRVARERDDDAVAATGAAAREGARETKDAARGAGRAVSDGWLTSKVYADFIDEDALEGSDIDVDVNAAVVTLKGTVASQAGSDRAAEVARGIEGVKSVRNNLKVTARK